MVGVEEGGFSSVAPRTGRKHHPGSPRVVASLIFGAVLVLLCLANWEGPDASPAGLYEGDPAHHVLDSKVKELWGIPVKKIHYEPPKLMSLATTHNSSDRPNKMSEFDSRIAMQRYYDKMTEAENRKLEPAHEDVMESMKEERVQMSEEDARNSLQDLPHYVESIRNSDEQELKANLEKDRAERAARDEMIAKQAMMRKVRVESTTKEPEFAGAGPYFDQIIRQDALEEQARREAREKMLQEDQHEREAEDAKIAEEVRQSAGAGNLDPPDKNTKEVEKLEKILAKPESVPANPPDDPSGVKDERNAIAVNSASEVAFDGSPIKTWADGPGLNSDDSKMKTARTSELKLVQRTLAKLRDEKRKNHAQSAVLHARDETLRDMTRYSQFVSAP